MTTREEKLKAADAAYVNYDKAKAVRDACVKATREADRDFYATAGAAWAATWGVVKAVLAEAIKWKP